MKYLIPINPQDLADAKQFSERNYQEAAPGANKVELFVYSVYALTMEQLKWQMRKAMLLIFGPLFNSFLYFLIFGVVLGKKIGLINGIPYIEFLVPGFMIMPVINISFSRGIFNTFNRIYYRHIDTIQRAPINAHAFIVGTTLPVILNSLFTCFLIWIYSLVFTWNFSIYNLSLAILVISLTSTVLNLTGMINGLYAKNFEETNFVPIFILMPLTYLSGIFYQVDTLPTFLHYASMLNPLTYIVSAFRYSFLGFGDSNIYLSLVFLFVFIMLLYSILLKVLDRRLNISQ